MTDRPAFSDAPQGSKTGSGFGNDPKSRAFLAEMAATYEDIGGGFVRRRDRQVPQPQTFDLTYRFTGATKHDPRLMLEATFRNGLPRGVTAEEVTDAY
jgi:hypothetical protein